MLISSSAQSVAFAGSPGARIIPFPGYPDEKMANQNANPHHWQGDRQCLMRVIQFLAKQRENAGESIVLLAKKAKIPVKVIERAEGRFVIPNSRQFRSWAEALGMTWEEVWNRAF